MNVKPPETVGDKTRRRFTLQDIVAMNHEERMAQLTKPSREATPFQVEVGRATTGQLSGRHYVKSATFAPHPDEDWPAFIGRVESSLADLARVLTEHDAADIQRQLAAATEAGKTDEANEKPSAQTDEVPF